MGIEKEQKGGEDAGEKDEYEKEGLEKMLERVDEMDEEMGR